MPTTKRRRFYCSLRKKAFSPACLSSCEDSIFSLHKNADSVRSFETDSILDSGEDERPGSLESSETAIVVMHPFQKFRENSRMGTNVVKEELDGTGSILSFEYRDSLV